MNYDETRYRNPLPYPTKVEVLDGLKDRLALVDSTPMTAAAREEAVASIHFDATETLRKLRDAYREKDAELHRLFKNDAEDEFGLADLPTKAKEAIHAKAWADGHSSGYYEVWNQYYDLAEIALAASAKP